MANFTDILPFILPETPSCPNFLALNHAVRAARELCRESKVMNVAGAFTPVNGKSAYNLAALLTVPADTEINRVLTAKQSGTPLSGFEIVDMDERMPGWELETSDTATGYVLENRRSMIVYPKPDVNATLPITVRVSLRPTIAAVTLDNDLFADYAEAITYGALYTLLTIPNKPWTNLAEAQNKLSQFNYWIERAKQDAIRGYSDQEMVVIAE